MKFTIPERKGGGKVASIHIPSEKNEATEGGHSHVFTADKDGIFTVPDRYVGKIMRSHTIVEVPDPSLAKASEAMKAAQPPRLATTKAVEHLNDLWEKIIKLRGIKPEAMEAAWNQFQADHGQDVNAPHWMDATATSAIEAMTEELKAAKDAKKA